MRLDEFGRLIPPTKSTSSSSSRDRDRRHDNYSRSEKSQRSREIGGEHRRDRRRSQSPPPARHSEKVPQKAEKKFEEQARNQKPVNEAKPAEAPPQEQEEEDAEMMMARMMGFGSFETTKGKHVDDDRVNIFSADVTKKRKYRQYMNRPGGYDQPLRND